MRDAHHRMPLQEKELRNILNVPTVACALVIGVSHALFFTSARPHYFRNPPLRSELVPALQRAGLHMVSFRDSTRGFIFLIVSSQSTAMSRSLPNSCVALPWQCEADSEAKQQPINSTPLR